MEAITYSENRSFQPVEVSYGYGAEIGGAVYVDGLVIGCLEEQLELHRRAVEARNPYQDRLIEIADSFGSLIEAQLTNGGSVELGGSLASRTAIRGNKNDVDLKVLLPESPDMSGTISDASARISGIIPFEKAFEHFSGEVTALKHKVKLEYPDIEGLVKIDCVITPAKGRVGYAKMQSHLPALYLDQYVLYKTDTLSNETSYRKVKQQFYAMTRQLYSWGYMDGDGSVAERSQMLAAATDFYWGTNLAQILARPTPEI